MKALNSFRRVSVQMWSIGRSIPAVMNRRAFSEFYDPYPQTPNIKTGEYLVQAVHDGEESTVDNILESGVDPNFRWKENITPVMVAAENNKMSIMQHLIKHGADINLQDDLGETALMKASRESHKEIVKELVKQGAQKDILNYEHMTAREATLDTRVDAILAGAPAEEIVEGTFAAPNATDKPL